MVFKVYKEDQNEEDSNPGVSIKVDSAVLQGHISFHSADSSLENSVGSLSTRESDNSKFNYCKKIDISTPKTSILNEKKHPEKGWIFWLDRSSRNEFDLEQKYGGKASTYF